MFDAKRKRSFLERVATKKRMVTSIAKSNSIDNRSGRASSWEIAYSRTKQEEEGRTLVEK